MAARREMVEETGFNAENLVDLGYIMSDAGVVAGRIHLYLVVATSQVSAQTPEAGLREFQWVPITQFESMLAESTIQDSFTLSAWCRYLINKKTQG